MHDPRPNSAPANGDARRWAALAIVCAAVTVIVMDGSIINVALPTLARSLANPSTGELQWIVDGYLLSFATLLISAGSAADRWGRRRVFMIGLVVFAAMSIGAAYSRTPLQLILWRSAMGIGAAMIFPTTLAIIAEAFPERTLRRGAIAAWAGCSGLGVACGPVVGGWLLESSHWSAVFLINIPIVAVALVAAAFAIRESRDTHVGRVDILGNALAILGLAAMVWGLIEGPERGWTSPVILTALTGAAVTMTAFVIWSANITSPMLDVRVFRNRLFAGSCGAIGVAFFGLFGFVFMVTQYLQFVCGYSPLEAGIRTLPFAAGILIGSGAAATLGARCRTRTVTALGLAAMAIGFSWTTIDQPDTPYTTLVMQMLTLGLGLGLVSASATDAIMRTLAANQFGLGSSINDTTREVGGVLGVAVMGSLFNSVYREEITTRFADSPLPDAARHALEHSMGAATIALERINDVAGPTIAANVHSNVNSAFMAGFHVASAIAGAGAFLGAISVFFALPHESSPVPTRDNSVTEDDPHILPHTEMAPIQ